MIKAVLCDLDGTLLDSNALHATAWKQAFEHFGFKFTFDAVLHQIGKGGDQLIPTFLSKGDRDKFEKPIEEFRKNLFHSEYFDKIKPFPEVRELVEIMRACGLRIAIASSSEKQDLQKLEAIAQISDLVEKETSSDDAEASKPAPDIFQAALNRLQLSASDCLALGDTPWDVKAAERTGVKTVALTCGGWRAEELKEAGAIEVYRDPAELKKCFNTSAFFVTRPKHVI